MRRIAIAGLAVALLVAACNSAESSDRPATSVASTSVLPASPAQLIETTEPDVFLLAASTADEPLSCPVPDGTIITPSSLPGHLAGVAQWIDVSRPALVEAMDRSLADRDNAFANVLPFEEVRALSDGGSLIALRRGLTDPLEEWLFRPGMDELLRRRTEDTVLVGLSKSAREASGFVTMTIVEHGDGGFTVIGRCERQIVAHGVQQYAAAIGESDVYGLLRQIASNDAVLLALQEWMVSASSDGPPGGGTRTTESPVPAFTSHSGRVVQVDKSSDFVAFRTGSQDIALGPMTIELDTGDTFQIPGRTLIDQHCRELDLNLPGEEPDPSAPSCVVRVDTNERGEVVDLWVLEPEEDPDGRFVAYIVVDVIGAVEGEVIFADRVRDRRHAWRVAPDTVFMCTGDEWKPPEAPSRGPTRYYLFLDIETTLVTHMVCQGSF